MDNNALIDSLKKENAELRRLLDETKRSELMYSNMLHFILNGEVPKSELDKLREQLK